MGVFLKKILNLLNHVFQNVPGGRWRVENSQEWTGGCRPSPLGSGRGCPRPVCRVLCVCPDPRAWAGAAKLLGSVLGYVAPPPNPPPPQEQLSPEELFMKSLSLRHVYGTIQYENWKDLEAVCQHPRGERVTFTTGSSGVTHSWASPGGGHSEAGCGEAECAVTA